MRRCAAPFESHRRLTVVSTLAVLIALAAGDASADLIKRTIHSDSTLAHSASVLDTVLFPAGTGYRSANWMWTAEQTLATDGRTWVIEIRARHLAGPHSDEFTDGPYLVAVLPDLAPGRSGGRQVRAPHHGQGHLDTLTIGYRPESKDRSRLTIRLEHESGGSPPVRGGTATPWVPVLVVVVVVVLIRGAWMSRPTAGRAQPIP